jgi:NAD(P)-dependent dehydrogenase (short-subunit alcohol dehydrogenase family)
MTTRRTAIFGATAMVASAALAEWARPTIRVSDLHPGFQLDQLFPSSFGEWHVDDNVPVIVPPPDQQAMLDKIDASVGPGRITLREGDVYALPFADASFEPRRSLAIRARQRDPETHTPLVRTQQLPTQINK